MNAKLFKLVFKPLSNWAAHRTLVGRNRSRHTPEQGRFTPAEVSNLVAETWESVDELVPRMIQEPTFGSLMNVRLAGLTLAFFRNLTAAGVERDYAIELIGDICWKIYQWWGHVTLFAGRRLHRDIIRDHEKRVYGNGYFSMSFPFNPPGYRTRYVPTDGGLGFDVIRCPVAEYFRAHGATALGVGTWCMLDYPLAEMGGLRLVRTQTLAAAINSAISGGSGRPSSELHSLRGYHEIYPDPQY